MRQLKLKGVAGGASGLKPRRGRRDAPGSKVLKKRRSPRERGRIGTSVRRTRLPEAEEERVSPPAAAFGVPLETIRDFERIDRWEVEGGKKTRVRYIGDWELGMKSRHHATCREVDRARKKRREGSPQETTRDARTGSHGDRSPVSPCTSYTFRSFTEC